MENFNTIVSLFREREKNKETGITFINGSDSSKRKYLSYHQVYWNAINRLGYLQQSSIKNGSYAIFQLDDNEEFITTFWACLLGNIIPMPIAVGLNDTKSIKFFHVLDMVPDAFIITTREIREKLLTIDGECYGGTYESRILKVSRCVEDMYDYNKPGEVFDVTPDTLAFVQFSSGSTGDPKGVMLTHHNLITNLRDIQRKAQIDEQDKVISWLPLTHDMGIIGFHLVPVLVGSDQYNMPTNLFARNPILWADVMDEYRATIVSSPNFGYKLFIKFYMHAKKRNKEFYWDLSCVRLIFNGAESISVETSIEFMDLLKKYKLKENAMYFVYGMAEASLGVTFPEPGQNYHYYSVNIHSLTIGNKVILEDTDNIAGNSLLLADCGTPLDSLSIKIVDKEGHLLEDGYIGRIQIKGDNVTKGYYHAEEYSATIINEQGWLNTGDIGVRVNGCLLVTGREKDIIIVNGVNYYATDIEEICEKGLNIKPGGIVACSLRDKETKAEVLGLFVQDSCKDIEAFRKKIGIIHSYVSKTLELDARYILPAQKISKTTSGKVQHFKLVEEYNNYEFDKWITLFYGDGKEQIQKANDGNGKTVEDILKEIACEVFEISNIEMDAEIMNYCSSSLKIVEMEERINQIYNNGIKISDIYDCTSLQDIAEMLRKRNGLGDFVEVTEEAQDNSVHTDKKIAITGIDVKLPRVKSLEELREVFCETGTIKKDLSDIRRKDVQNTYENVTDEDFAAGYYLDRIDTFDWEFFNITPKEAELLSPVQRIFLQSAYGAIQDAGYTEEKISNSQTGVFVGYISDLDNYKYKENIMENATKEEKEISVAGNLSSIISGRLSNYLNLHGPSMVIDTACSSSLSALYMACQSISQGDCNSAVVGGIRIKIYPVKNEAKLGIESESGVLRPFDDKADGTVEGEGCITLFLKDYEEAKADYDPIYAVILSGAINQDGRSASLTSPSAEAQSKLITKAWKRSGISPEQIGYIEAHGTGTKVGDIIELEGLSKAFSQFTHRKQFCAVSTAKAVFGHTYDLAGLLGVVRTVLQLKYKELYGTPNLSIPNSKFEFANSPIWTNEQYQRWENTERRIAGVSAFGFSGTNCHLVLAEPEEVQGNLKKEDGENILYITAKSKVSLIGMLSSYRKKLETLKEGQFASFCYSVNEYVEHFKEYQVIILAENYKDMMDKLGSAAEELQGKQTFVNNIYFILKNQKSGVLDTKHPYYPCAKGIVDNGDTCWPERISGLNRIHIPTYEFQESRVWYACKNKKRKGKKESFHQLQWKKNTQTKTSQNRYDRKYLMICERNARSNKLLEAFPDAVVINESNLLQEMKYWEEKETIVVTYFIEQPNEEAVQLDMLKGFVNSQLKKLFGIMKSLNDTLHVTFVLAIQNTIKVHEEDNIIPELAMLTAMIRSVAVEMPHVNFKVVDYGEETQIDKIKYAVEMERMPWIAIRENAFYNPCIVEVKGKTANKKVEIKKEGTYLITGALGAAGMSLVLSLIKKYNANVILTGRRKEDDCQDKLKTFGNYQEHINYYSCDVSKEEEVNYLYQRCQEKYSKIDGVFHLAGISGAGLTIQKEFEKVEKVFAPKVYGICNLMNTFGKNNLDFMFLFSSGMTLFPEIGQCEYVMANQYLDAIADSKGGDQNIVYSVNWPVFSDSGMAEQTGYINNMFHSIHIGEVMGIVEKVLAQTERNVIVGRWKWEDKKNEFLRKYGYFTNNDENEEQVKPSVIGYSRLDIQKQICSLIEEVTGLQVIDPNENFLSKGVDSILLVRLHNKIEACFPRKRISISQMFAMNTVEKLTEILYQGSEENVDNLGLQISNWLTQVEEQKLSIGDMAEKLNNYEER